MQNVDQIDSLCTQFGLDLNLELDVKVAALQKIKKSIQEALKSAGVKNSRAHLITYNGEVRLKREVTVELLKKGYTCNMVAKELGVKYGYVSVVADANNIDPVKEKDLRAAAEVALLNKLNS